MKEAIANKVSTFIYEKIIYKHELSRKVITDRESHFNNQIVEELLKKFKIKYNLFISYYLKTNGLVERYNKTLYKALVYLRDEQVN